VALGFDVDRARSMEIPAGFGFLVPQRELTLSQGSVLDAIVSEEVGENTAQRALLACTFLSQKFPHTAPDGAVLLRAFFGGPSAPDLLAQDDATLIRVARTLLERFLGKLPEPSVGLTRRWPISLPLYEVGHQERIASLDLRVAKLPNLRLIGNAYRGVGLPDLICSGRAVAREIVAG
jgi:oxygen-dependent protoporphyrinogen oxidase